MVSRVVRWTPGAVTVGEYHGTSWFSLDCTPAKTLSIKEQGIDEEIPYTIVVHGFGFTHVIGMLTE